MSGLQFDGNDASEVELDRSVYATEVSVSKELAAAVHCGSGTVVAGWLGAQSWLPGWALWRLAG